MYRLLGGLVSSFLVVDKWVVVHLIEFLAEEIGVFLREVYEIDTTLEILLELLSTIEYLVRGMYVTIYDLAYELYLFVSAKL